MSDSGDPPIIVDANRVMSALLGGAALRILFDPQHTFVMPVRTTWEVMRYVPFLAERTRTPEEDVLQAFERMPIEAIPDDEYRHRMPDVERLGLRDPRDADLVALALERSAPIWSHDRDLLDLAGVTTLTDNDLL